MKVFSHALCTYVNSKQLSRSCVMRTRRQWRYIQVHLANNCQQLRISRSVWTSTIAHNFHSVRTAIAVQTIVNNCGLAVPCERPQLLTTAADTNVTGSYIVPRACKHHHIKTKANIICQQTASRLRVFFARLEQNTCKSQSHQPTNADIKFVHAICRSNYCSL